MQWEEGELCLALSMAKQRRCLLWASTEIFNLLGSGRGDDAGDGRCQVAAEGGGQQLQRAAQ